MRSASEHGSTINGNPGDHETTFGRQIRQSRSYDSMNMSPRTPCANTNNNGQANGNKASNGYDAYAGNHGKQFQIGNNDIDDVFAPTQTRTNLPVTGTAVAMRNLDSAATARLEVRPPDTVLQVDGRPDARLDSRPDTRLDNRPDTRLDGRPDAQGIYPVTACVFVANLPEPKDDLALEAAVTRIFSRFGTVFVKIRRDASHMPFAFAQYTNDEDAKRAEAEGRGAVILGRPCRTEMVRANRTFIVYRTDRQLLTIHQAGELLVPYGNFSKIEFMNGDIATTLGYNHAVLIEFSGFDRSRDLITDIRMGLVGNSHGFRVETFDPRRNSNTRVNRDEDFLRRYDQDRRSVFVSNLPGDTTQAQLRAFFDRIGPINKIDVVMRHHQETHALLRVFAFIEFADHQSAPEAIRTLNDANFFGYQVKVQKKITKGADNSPRANGSPNMSSPLRQFQNGDTPVRPYRAHTQANNHNLIDTNRHPGGHINRSTYIQPNNSFGGVPAPNMTPAPVMAPAPAMAPVPVMVPAPAMAPAPGHPHGHVPGYNMPPVTIHGHPNGYNMPPTLPQAQGNGYNMPPGPTQAHGNGYDLPPGVANNPGAFGGFAASATAPPQNPAMAGGYPLPSGAMPYVDPMTGIYGFLCPMPNVSGMPGMTGAPGVAPNQHHTGAPGAAPMPVNTSTPVRMMSLPYRPAHRAAPSSGGVSSGGRASSGGRHFSGCSSSSGSSDSSPRQRGARLN
ncbi:hypothetical protein QBC38DRAFT_463773 [Podospora fimiseda]|uniref:RRM domain-containing protein n=1 Tax=Podospora fimiseda TaxID=252190 RepID=A0AAN7BZG7_9PEZI|nr:hypothetical protein QBC38DRAFT_463773 [Podospora fimiseda]